MDHLVDVAEEIATRAHSGQFRRGGVVPYIEHPRAVVARVGDDPEFKIVAWLHDVIEDTDETEASLIEAGIPPHLVEAVKLLTKEEGVQYETYLDRVAANRVAKAVKVADMLSNLSDTPTDKQIRKYAEGLLNLTPIVD